MCYVTKRYIRDVSLHVNTTLHYVTPQKVPFPNYKFPFLKGAQGAQGNKKP